MSFSDGGIILRPGEGKAIQVPGHPITYKATKEDTGGAYSLLEVVVTGEGPPQHIHKAEEEAFYVLEGAVNIKIGEQTISGTVGSFVLIPRGTVHTFWNAGPDTATFIEKGMAVAQKYNLEVVGPPLG